MFNTYKNDKEVMRILKKGDGIMGVLRICDVFQGYKENEKKDNILLELSEIKLGYEYGSIGAATDRLENIFESLQYPIMLTSTEFTMLIQLSIYLNRFSSLLKVCRENPLLLQQDSSVESEIIEAYLAYEDGKYQFPLEQLMRKLSNRDEIHVFTYVISHLVENIEVKRGYLREACKGNTANLGALRELLALGEDISLMQLRQLYQNDDKLFVKNFCIRNEQEPKRKLNFNFTPLGGGNDIGASCYLLQLGSQNILVDVGIKFKKHEREYPDFNKLETICPLEDITMVVITHAHLDHCGGILELYKKNKSLTFIMTKQTKELLKVNLSLDTGTEDYYLLEDLLRQSVILGFHEPIKVGTEGMILELYPAGHILGAAALWIQSPYGNVFMTGDYSLENQYTVNGLEVENLPVDILITETTYGDRKECGKISRKQIEKELVNYVIEQINAGKKVLIPAFAIGRSQELIAMLKEAAKVNDFRLYIDGQVQIVNKIYEAKSGFSAQGQSIYNVSGTRYQDKATFIEEEFINNRSCVIASSGMLEKGSSSLEYAKQILGRSDGVCILTGFQAVDTIGARLKEQMRLGCERYIEIENVYYKIRAGLAEFNLSAHCEIADILALATKLKSPHVILMHGECKTEKTYIHQVLEKVTHVVQSHNGTTIQIRED